MCRACATDERAALFCDERVADYLRRTYLFEGLSGEQIEEMVGGTRTVELETGRWLFHQGDAAARFYVVREGQIALFRQSDEGRESIVAVVGRDEVFGEELLFLDEARHHLNARAVGAATVLSLDRSRFRAYLEGSVSLAFRVMETLYRRQTLLLDHVERLTLQNATQRVMTYLLAQVEGDDGPQRLELTLPKATLAAHLSIQPETLSRVLGRLKECEYIREDGDELVVETRAMRSGLSCSACAQRWGCPGPHARLLDPGEWPAALEARSS
ncbi:MAG: Crp/Fnr family transcriptional regulator [Thermoanaerobaculia bacterium]|nr:Crp/Fnr family transcriptional regulator [Thermoanaerobaculia bacterium]